MSGPKIHLNGYLDVPSERMGAVLDALPLRVELTMGEVGCIKFEVTQSDEVENRLIVSETFIDKPSFDHHNSRAKASAWAEVTAGIPREYQITEE
jgi:quinol monooxygenase YgiN